MCICRTMSRICSSAAAGGLITTSTPSPSTVSSESVTRAATSTRASVRRSSPVISQSIQTMRSCERSLFRQSRPSLYAPVPPHFRRTPTASPLASADVSEFGPYRPVVPAGLPPEQALPAPARPRLRVVLVWVAVVVVTGGCALLTLALITTVTGVLGAATGTALAVIPVFPVVAAFGWLDRYEAEPTSLLAFAFAWGAGVASLGALVDQHRLVAGDPGRRRRSRAPPCWSWRR